MRKVLEKLKTLSNKINLFERFDYDFEINHIFNNKDKKKIIYQNNPFDKNKILKQIIRKKYEQKNNYLELDFWIINEWGGIRGFKKNQRNIEKINKFKKQIYSNKITKESFSTISSLSKIASFINPDVFFIYDSRVIYSLNWLILTCENQENLNEKYFPLPNGRNKIISNYDMNTIINISHINEFGNARELYIKEQDAYLKYCDFIINGVSQVFDREVNPFELEMLLFTIADKEIFDDIKRNIKITTNRYL